MNITSDFKFDSPSQKLESGSYEWWYFDATDATGHWSIVVIFYDGCPFSTRYNKNYANGGLSIAKDHPAISISLYYDYKPVFYSMTEYKPNDCSFSATGDEININVGNNSVQLKKTDGKLIHTLKINERMPSGDKLQGMLVFESKHNPEMFKGTPPAGQHHWNLTQPHARVHGTLEHKSGFGAFSRIYWKGNGYHDHNLGFEPMKEEFDDWYWGRIHFPSYTLVYYLMRKNNVMEFKGWLFDDKMEVVKQFDKGKVDNEFHNLFNLTCGAEIHLGTEEANCRIYQRNILDKGPFYYRFLGDAVLHLGDITERAIGITEYIRPENIHKKKYWPLINMRYHYKGEPNWVQKSPVFYRLTWKGL